MKVGEKLPSSIVDLVQKVIPRIAQRNLKLKREIVHTCSRFTTYSKRNLNIYGFDISYQKELEEKLQKREEALKESEERLLLAQQVAEIGTFEWDIQTG